MINSDLISKSVKYKPRLTKKSLRYFTVFAFIYVFFNSFLLPAGLTFTILLTPFLILWLRKQRNISLLKVFGIFTVVFVIAFVIHYYNGIDVKVYVQSSVLYLTCVVFATAFYSFINSYNFLFETIATKIVKFNFVMVIIAILSYAVWRDHNIFWYSNEITTTLSFPRLKLLTTESSEYSLILIPFLFFFFNYYYYANLNKKRFWLLASIVFSLLLSLSYGALGLMAVTISILIAYNFLLNRRKKYNFKLLTTYILGIGVVLFLFLGPLRNSGIVNRILSIFSGNDSSTNGRSTDSYILADYILSLKQNFWFGIGPGQLKLIGKNVIIDYYQYVDDYALGVVRIPCNIAEVFVTFGYTGVIVKLFFEIYLFIKTKVKTSSFRFCMFLFVFIYQFLGSNIVNISEYVIWILAFSNAFPDSYFKKLVLKQS